MKKMAGERNYASGNRRYDQGRYESYGRSARTGTYVYGNAVENPVYTPERRQKVQEPKRQVSRQVKRNRRRAARMSRGYAVFLGLSFALVMAMGVYYVRLQNSVAAGNRNIIYLQNELTSLKEKNTTDYNAVMNSMNLETVRQRAQNDLGMIYASPQQMIEYTNPVGDYVKKYEAIPSSGKISKHK